MDVNVVDGCMLGGVDESWERLKVARRVEIYKVRASPPSRNHLAPGNGDWLPTDVVVTSMETRSGLAREPR
jgi:hypothetical protein